MNNHDTFNWFAPRFVTCILIIGILSMIWAVRRGQAAEMERNARIAQFQQHYIACDAGPDVPGWIGG